MRKVVNRVGAAGLLAVLCASVLLAPPQASGRAGGLAAGHATFSRAGFGRGSFGHRDLTFGDLRFDDFRRLGGQPFVRLAPVPLSGRPVAVNRASALEPHHRRFFGFGLPIGGIGVWEGPFDQPGTDVGYLDRPAGATAAQDGDRMVADRGCRSETRIIPSENGGERSIRITWCRKG
jgi:hypothetical protein